MLVKGGKQVFFNLLLDGAQGVAMMANARRGGCEVEDGFQLLVLEIDQSNAP